MKQTDNFLSIGNAELCAWPVDEQSCWIQIRNPDYAKQLRKIVEIKRVATGVAGGYLAIYEVHRTIQWIDREIVQKLLPLSLVK
jgi:hypothetical protein